MLLPFPPFAGAAFPLLPLLGRLSNAAAAASSERILNLTLISIFVGFEMRMRSTTPRPKINSRFKIIWKINRN